jgi:hypothetical protein
MVMRIYFEVPANPQENRQKTSPFTTSNQLPRTGGLQRPGGTGGLLGRLGTGPLGNGNNPINNAQKDPSANGTGSAGQPPNVNPDGRREPNSNNGTPPSK